MENKKNKGLAWLIVVLIILFIGLVSLVVYNTLLKNKNKSDPQPTTTTTTVSNKLSLDDIYPKEHSDGVLFDYYLSRLLYNDGENLVNQETNFKLQTFKTPEGLEFSVKCSAYEELTYGEMNYCTEIEFNIDNVDMIYTDHDGCGSDVYFIKTADYLFVREEETICVGHHGSIKIYKKGNLVYEIEDYADDTNYGNYEMKFHDNKLYFIAVTDENNYNYSLNYIDMSKEEIETIKVMDLDTKN